MTGKQRRHLRALGHHLDPVVQVGKEGPSQGLLGALDAALVEHELVKVRLGEQAAGDRHAIAESLAESTGAELIQVLGRTLLLYRRHPDEPKIQLPPGA
jgi:RNA-binding protein